MRKVHISLVGKETVPIYLGIKEAEPDIVFLIRSSNTKAEAERIVEQFPNIEIKTIEFEPMNLGRIFSDIKELEKQLLDDDIISLNLVGGTKFWSLAFYSVFNKKDNATIYLVDQQNNIWDFSTQTFKQLEFDITKVFELNGNPLTKYTRFDEYTSEDFVVVNDIYQQIRRTNFEDFNKLTSPTDNKTNNEIKRPDGELSLPTGSKVEWLRPDYAVIYLHKKNRYVNEIRDFKLCSPHSVDILFSTHWFEVKVAQLLSKIYKAENIYLNCVFRFKKVNTDKNEVDIIVNAGEKLLFVECKTQIKNTTDIDKFATVVRNFGGKGSKALFVTDAKMSLPAIEKCKESNIAFFSLKDYDNNKVAIELEKQLTDFINDINK